MAHNIESLEIIYQAPDMVEGDINVERGYIYDPTSRGYTEGFYVFSIVSGKGISLYTRDAERIAEMIIAYLNSEDIGEGRVGPQ